MPARMIWNPGYQRFRRDLDRKDGIDKTVKALADRGVEIVNASWSGHYPPASSPGEPPAIRTGTLKASVHSEKEKPGTWLIVAGGDDAYYAVFLEYGTEKMVERPFMRPMVAKLEKEANKKASEVFSIVLRDYF